MNGFARWVFLPCLWLGTMGGVGIGDELPQEATDDVVAEMARLQQEYDDFEEGAEETEIGVPADAREREFCSRAVDLAKRAPGTPTEFAALLLVLDAGWSDDAALEQMYGQAMARLIALYPRFLDNEHLMTRWVESMDHDLPACREALRRIADGGRGAGRAEALLTLAGQVMHAEVAWMRQDPMVGMGTAGDYDHPIGRSSRVRLERLAEARGYLDIVKRDHPDQGEEADGGLRRLENLSVRPEPRLPEVDQYGTGGTLPAAEVLDKGAVADLVKRLGDGEYEVRIGAYRRLLAWGLAGPGAALSVLPASEEDREAHAALALLRKRLQWEARREEAGKALIGNAPLQGEVDRLFDARSEMALRRFASRMACEAPRQAAGILSGFLDHEDPGVRRAAAECLGFLREPSCEKELRKASQEDPDPAVQAEASGALLRLDFDAVDQDGKGFKLSDYEGKVVLLAFWGFW